jgi:hypothetical protein
MLVAGDCDWNCGTVLVGGNAADWKFGVDELCTPAAKLELVGMMIIAPAASATKPANICRIWISVREKRAQPRADDHRIRKADIEEGYHR